MKNLGKIIFIIFSFIATATYASVTAQVTPKVVYSGEVATYILTIVGDKVEKPVINEICGTNVIGTSSQTSIQMVNMDYQKSYILSYRFMPRKSCVIPPVSIRVDDKTEQSNEVKVKVTKAVQDKNADFVLSLNPSKKELYVGEPFTLTLVLKQKQSAQAVDSKFVAPSFKGFWIKGEPQTTRSEDAEHIITTAIYKLAPQREGNLTIEPAQIKIATRMQSRDSWGTFLPQVQWRTYYSNEVHIHAKRLPNNAKLVGRFTIKARADKTQINPSEPVNVTVEVDGEGNLEDISSFKPYVQGVNVFAEKVEVNGNKLTQKLAFVSDKDFTIPAFSIAFYNLDSKRVEKISTKPIYIKVTGSQNSNEEKLNIKRDTSSNDNSNTPAQTQSSSSFVGIFGLLIAFVLGTAFGVFLVLLKPLKRFKKEKVFNIKDEKLLLIKLLPFKDKDEEVKKIVDILEGNIYSGSKQKIDKKVLKEILKKYDIS
ncbi:BatD family protein [Sulfurimonas sp.]|uniref:BatD family protein n=1 Tax=Sulfurimonas sp. TaxID=2022749 RepID=UPI0026078105|nr:BatD family protein [Sulfurimonas sp.]